MPASAFANKLAGTALDQHSTFQFMDEGDLELCKQIKKYWDDLSLGFESCTAVPWSAVFVSWCVKKAGATNANFKFAAAHSQFVFDAINNPRAFKGHDIADHAPAVGDIIQNNGGGSTFNFAHAKTHKSYQSHSAIVVEVGSDSGGGFALTIGGNEGDAIRRKVVRLKSNGLIKQRTENPFISVLQNQK